MAFCQLDYFSEALSKQTTVNLVLPSTRFAPPFQVMFLLHGLSDNHTMWMRRSSIERYVEDLPLIVVMPDTGRGFYVDPIVHGPKYGTAIGQELPLLIQTMFRTVDTWSVTGLSMGGYGALKMALNRPDLFRSAASHSGAVHFGHFEPPTDDPFWVEFAPILGSSPVGGPHDLVAGFQAADRATLPKLWIDCGVDDFLLEANRDFHQFLAGQEIAHVYHEFPGEHTWAYWDEHVQDAIRFHRQNLGF